LGRTPRAGSNPAPGIEFRRVSQPSTFETHLRSSANLTLNSLTLVSAPIPDSDLSNGLGVPDDT
jgi:hypothetical protein